MSTFGRVCPGDMTPKQRRDALIAITLIKEKRPRKIKGRSCVDGRAQRAYITKEKAAAPTILVEALLAQLMIDAFGERAM